MAEGRGDRTKSLRELNDDLQQAEEAIRKNQAEFAERSQESERLAINVAQVEMEGNTIETEVAGLRGQCDAERKRLNGMLEQIGPLLQRGGQDLDEKLKEVMNLTQAAEEHRQVEQRLRRQRIKLAQRIEETKRSIAEERRMVKMLPGHIQSAQNHAAELVAHWTGLGREVGEAEKALDVQRSSRAEEDKQLQQLRDTVDGLESAIDFARRRYEKVDFTRTAQSQSFCMARELEANELRNELASTRAQLDKRLRELSMLRDATFKNGLEIQALRSETDAQTQRGKGKGKKGKSAPWPSAY